MKSTNGVISRPRAIVYEMYVVHIKYGFTSNGQY